MKRSFLPLFALVGLLGGTFVLSAQQPVALSLPVAALAPTDHPLVPAGDAQLWMRPTKTDLARTPTLTSFATAVKLETEGSSAKALPILAQPLLRTHALGKYAQYYRGLVQLSLGQAGDARRTFQALTSDPPVGF